MPFSLRKSPLLDDFLAKPRMIGVLVPTLFKRLDYLVECIDSIRTAGDAYVICMGPRECAKELEHLDLWDDFLDEPDVDGLAAKIEFGLNSFPKNLQLVTWIGDDDKYAPSAFDHIEAEFQRFPNACLIFGSCEYINSGGAVIGKNRSSQAAITIAKFGPFLAPQPGSVFRRECFQAIGGLDKSLGLAFDFDLFMSLRKQGKVKFTNKTLGQFRWHPESLSVSQRSLSAKEASVVRLKHATVWSCWLVRLLNPMVEKLTIWSGSIVSRKLGIRD